jgi:2-deoxy-D-gluconate 3-dehydrogenase
MSDPTQLFSVEGKRAIITGGGTGLGRAAAEVLHDGGARVAILGRDYKRLKDTAADISTPDNKVLPVKCDVALQRQITSAVSRIRSHFEKIDILINNAGIIIRYPARDYPVDDWKSVIDVNLTGAFIMAQSVGRLMLEQGSGKIINIASMLSFSGGVLVPSYTASKHGIVGITQALANEWSSQGVNVNAIAPGYFETAATKPLRKDKKRFKAVSDRIPAGRWGVPDDLKGAVIFLSSAASDYVHGHTLAVDGGWLAA